MLGREHTSLILKVFVPYYNGIYPVKFYVFLTVYPHSSYLHPSKGDLVAIIVCCHQPLQVLNLHNHERDIIASSEGSNKPLSSSILVTFLLPVLVS